LVRSQLSSVLALGLAMSALILGLPSSVSSQPRSCPDNVVNASCLDVVLGEIAWMGTTASPADEWIELYNNTSSAVGLSGWTLSSADGTPSIPLSGSIPGGGYFLLERTDDATVPGVSADRTYGGGLGNHGEGLILRDATSSLVDRVDCTLGSFAGHAEARVLMVHGNLTATRGIRLMWICRSQSSTTYTRPASGRCVNTEGVSESD
jgi:hypothetical protein